MKTFSGIETGKRAEHTKTLTEEDVRLYARLTGDYNPVHLDEEYARNTRFGRPVAHGLLTCGLIQTSLTELVAPGGVSLSYGFELLRPVFLDDTITAVAEITEKLPDRKLIVCTVRCANQHGDTVVTGEATIKMLTETEFLAGTG
jgi:acyl dehydratase